MYMTPVLLVCLASMLYGLHANEILLTLTDNMYFF